MKEEEDGLFIPEGLAFGDQDDVDDEITLPGVDDIDPGDEPDDEDEADEDAADIGNIKDDEDLDDSEDPEEQEELSELNPEDEKLEEPTEEVNKEEEALISFISLWNSEIGDEITDDDLEDPDASLKSIIDKKIVKNAQSMFNQAVGSLNSVEQDAVMHLMNGGSLDEFIEIGTAKTYDYTADDLEDDSELQASTIKDYLKARGISDKSIKRTLAKLDPDEMFEEAAEALEYLKTTVSKGAKKKTLSQRRKEAAEKAQRDNEERNARILNSAVDKIMKTDEFIPGKKIRKGTKEALASQVANTINKIIQNLEKYGGNLTLIDYYGMLDGDFSKVSDAGSKKATTSLKNLLKSKQKVTKSTNNRQSSLNMQDVIKAASGRYKRK